jgi:hypothetical protein
MRNRTTLMTSATGAVLALALAITTAATAAGTHQRHGGGGQPGASGVGDPYYPLDGNGGYDVSRYDLDLRYDPATDLLAGKATIEARANKKLSAFNLDLDGLTVRAVTVDGQRATWSRAGQELTVTPRRSLEDRRRFTVRVTYDGVPHPISEPSLGMSGFLATDDGVDIAGQPHVAATWFPVNDHPTDKASYRFEVTVPDGPEVVANGDLVKKQSRRGWTTWTWSAVDPMASYLTTVDVGEFDLTSYRRGGIRYLDAIDPDLFDPLAEPSTGTRFAVSRAADSSYKRLVHTFAVPAGGSTVGFTVTRNTERDWDYFFVEAHTVGQDDWTTLPDTQGHTSQDTGNSCFDWPGLHPFISHYQTVDEAAGTCSPIGSTGVWNAATGVGEGPEQWSVDLAPFAGKTVELALSYVSDGVVQRGGVFVDDIVVSTGAGSTSFETGLDGWTVPGPPMGSPGNANDWIVGTVADVPPPPGEIAAGSFAREPEILGFLASYFGPYPWRSAGGIVDDIQGLGFALETQTRPIYAPDFFSDPVSGDGVVVHELAHQWYGDSLAVKRWRDIWLNEGFATYAEWLWSEREGLGTVQQIFDDFASIPADYEGWGVIIGDPGPDHLFEFPVYFRGAMTLHTLRQQVGDQKFFRIIRTWATSRAGGNVTTPEFIALAERISGQQLDSLFQTWLYTPCKPAVLAARAQLRSPGTTPPAVRAAMRIAGSEGLRR